MTQAIATPDAKSDQEKAPPAVEGGELKRLSVSQVQTFDASQDGGCARKWYFEKVLGKKPPETKSQAIGTEVHRQIEHYLKTGEDVLGPIARSGKHFIPAPNPELIAVEVPFNGQLKAAGIPFVGSIDLVNASGAYLDEQGELCDLGEGVVEVCDWKTSGDVAKWAKPGSALMRTVQMPGYGVFVSQVLPGIEKVRLSHATFQTKGAKAAVKSTVLVPVEKLIERWTTVEGVVREMKDVAHEKEIEKVPMNLSACSAFGGCPHADICPRPKEAILRGALGGTRNNMTSLMNRLSALNNTSTTTAPPAQAATPVEPPAPAPKVLGGGILGRIGALASASKAEAPAPEAKAEPQKRRILVCGSRDWQNANAIAEILRAVAAKYGSFVLIHGAASGADSLADDIGAQMGVDVVPFPADWNTHGKSAGSIRNAQMLKEGRPDEVFAFRTTPESVGTNHMIRIARAAGVPVTVTDAKAPAKAEPLVGKLAGDVHMRRTIPASEARVGHHYGLAFSHGVVEAEYAYRTKAGLAFAKLDKTGVVTLDETAPVIVLGRAGPNAVLPVDAPYSGVSGPKAEGEKSEVQEAIERAQSAQVAAKMAQALAQAATEDDEGEIIPEAFQQQLAPADPVAAAGEEPPKRTRGRPPGAKNKKTLEREAALAEAAGEIEPPKPETLAQLVETHPQAVGGGRVISDEAHKLPAGYMPPAIEARTVRTLDEQAAFKPVAQHPATGNREDGPVIGRKLTVYIDAYPVKGAATNLDTYVQGILKAVCDTYKVADVRLGSQGSDLGYGKWKAVLAVCVAAQPPPPGTYYLLSRGNEVLEVMAQAIVEAADVAVVGR